MKPCRLSFTALALVLMVSGAHSNECLPSLKAARAAHPESHLAWSGGCYYKGYGRRHHHVVGNATPVPTPQDRSDDRVTSPALSDMLIPADIPPPPAPRWIVEERFEAASVASDEALRRGLEHEATMLRILALVDGAP